MSSVRRSAAPIVLVVLLVSAGAFGAYRALSPTLGPPASAPAASLPMEAASAPSQASAAPSSAPPKRRLPSPVDDVEATTLAEQREALFFRMESQLELSPERLAKVKGIFASSSVLGQGNPEVTKHPMTRAECREIRAKAGLETEYDEACGAWGMVPLRGASSACIDTFEFPNIACEYPVVFARADEAEALCEALGKRLCDAHEWEGACAGEVLRPEADYRFDLPRKEARFRHNEKRAIRWAYGEKKDHALCGTASHKDDDCRGGGYKTCGSNTYPAGAFPACVSPLGVYDQHGNAAEHMNLPLKPAELLSRGGSGETEMKGSWFIFSAYEAHPDDCRWRAPDWHVSKLKSPESHLNYHLGFRCCKDLSQPSAPLKSSP